MSGSAKSRKANYQLERWFRLATCSAAEIRKQSGTLDGQTLERIVRSSVRRYVTSPSPACFVMGKFRDGWRRQGNIELANPESLFHNKAMKNAARRWE